MKSKILYFSITFLLSLWVNTGLAQEKLKSQEVGLTFSNLDRFGITYRFGKESKRCRFNLIQSNVDEDEFSDDISVRQSENFSIALGIGREKRKSIGDNLSLRYGLDLTLGYNRSKDLRFGIVSSENDFISKTRSVEAMISFVGGLNYECNERLLFGAEILPSFGYGSGSTERESGGSISESNSSNYFFRLSNGGALLSVVYTF